jgi:hypothetical protein
MELAFHNNGFCGTGNVSQESNIKEFVCRKTGGRDSKPNLLCCLLYVYLFILEGDDSTEVILAKGYYANRATHNWTRELSFNYMVPTKSLADLYLATDGLPITKSSLFQGYNTLTSEFQNRDPRMVMTFVVPGSDIFFEGGLMQPTFPGFSGSNATRTGYMIRKFLDETVDATQFIGQYDFKALRYAAVLLILAEALYEKMVLSPMRI